MNNDLQNLNSGINEINDNEHKKIRKNHFLFDEIKCKVTHSKEGEEEVFFYMPPRMNVLQELMKFPFEYKILFVSHNHDFIEELSHFNLNNGLGPMETINKVTLKTKLEHFDENDVYLLDQNSNRIAKLII